MNHQKPYRKNAGIVVFNSLAQALVGERLESRGRWQFPQGGIDEGESALDAARRELYEETGLQIDDEPILEYPDWLTYDFPSNPPESLAMFQGQTQKWFFFYWDGKESELDLDVHKREFTTVCWMDLDKIVDQIVGFKKAIYTNLQTFASPQIRKFLADQGKKSFT